MSKRSKERRRLSREYEAPAPLQRRRLSRARSYTGEMTPADTAAHELRQQRRAATPLEYGAHDPPLRLHETIVWGAGHAFKHGRYDPRGYPAETAPFSRAICAAGASPGQAHVQREEAQMEPFLRPGQVGQLLGVDAGTVRDWIDRQVLRGVQHGGVGGHRKVLIPDLEAYLARTGYTADEIAGMRRIWESWL